MEREANILSNFRNPFNRPLIEVGRGSSFGNKTRQLGAGRICAKKNVGVSGMMGDQKQFPLLLSVWRRAGTRLAAVLDCPTTDFICATCSEIRSHVRSGECP